MFWYGPILQRQNISVAHLAVPPLIAVLREAAEIHDDIRPDSLD